MKVINLYNNPSLLIKEAASNNRRAQHQLYEMHASKMVSICRYYIKDLQKAEEVMLNGFFKAFINLKNFRNDGSFEGWLRKIMVREAISYLRQEKKMEFFLDDVQAAHQPSNNIATVIELDDIQQYIDDLPEGYKVVFVMYAIEGYKHQEIAAMLNINEGTSKSQLFKARQLLQNRINKSNQINIGTNEMGR